MLFFLYIYTQCCLSYEFVWWTNKDCGVSILVSPYCGPSAAVVRSRWQVVNSRNRHRAGPLAAAAREGHHSDRSFVGRERDTDRRAAEPAGHPQPGPELPPWIQRQHKRVRSAVPPHYNTFTRNNHTEAELLYMLVNSFTKSFNVLHICRVSSVPWIHPFNWSSRSLTDFLSLTKYCGDAEFPKILSGHFHSQMSK